MTTKICNTCNASKTLDQFSKNKASPDGHTYRCKACSKAYMAAYQAENRDQLKAKKAAYHADHREQAAARNQSPKGKYTHYKHGAKRRGLEWDLTMDEFMSFWKVDCSYCGDPISTIGIDRIDSDLGYVVGNCVPCCKRCNEIKMDYSQDETDAHMIKSLRHRGII